MRAPVWPGYFADPFVLAVDGGYVAYGTDPTRDDGAFASLTSPDLVHWCASGPVLEKDPLVGTDYWAPEAVVDEGGTWLLYSAGRGIDGHHLRVAHAADPRGPFLDQGVDLSPDEPFAIDPHPFVDADGSRWLFFARDVLDHERPGTHLAVRPMRSWTEPGGPAQTILQPNADWQRYEADRLMYGRRLDWHTLEGPTVVRRGDAYVLLYSGGSWQGDGYGVASAVASSPLGPWRHAATSADVLSSATTGLPGPGHNSVVSGPGGVLFTAYHAWNEDRTRRQAYVEPLHWTELRPHLVDLTRPRRLATGALPAR